MEIVSFLPESEVGPLTPSEFYRTHYDQFIPNPYNNEQKNIYLSGPITSGGAIRMRETNPEISIPEIISLNRECSLCICDLLANLNELLHAKAVLPHTIGLRSYLENGRQEYWSEKDYLLLWLSVIGGFTPEAAEYFQAKINATTEITTVFGDHHASRKDRIEQYRALESLTAEFATTTARDSHPIDAVLALPDSNLSLGSTLEQRTAQNLDIPVLDIAFNPNHPEYTTYALANDTVMELLLQNELVELLGDCDLVVSVFNTMRSLDYLE